ncbi:MAG: glycogen/starch/alpha-glucan phosphorylase, partial [Candidatus Omnitrophica bacterium]|nr:glycogen/starch/alpha-glucan phosphorylase [Candidatus Omnitrophota bacterium]
SANTRVQELISKTENLSLDLQQELGTVNIHEALVSSRVIWVNAARAPPLEGHADTIDEGVTQPTIYLITPSLDDLSDFVLLHTLIEEVIELTAKQNALAQGKDWTEKLATTIHKFARSQIRSLMAEANVLPSEHFEEDRRRENPEVFFFTEDQSNSPLAGQFRAWNELYTQQGATPVINEILANPEFRHRISEIIRSHDRQESAEGFNVGQGWAESFKQEVLDRATQVLKGRDIFIFQMEYELSTAFLQAFYDHLVNLLGCKPRDALHNTGQFAKLLMAGGLGSFKPDLVHGFYDVLSKYWGALEARNHLHVMGVLYSSAVKGQLENRGLLQLKGKVEKVDLIESVLINRKHPEHALLALVDTFEIKIYNFGIETVTVELYRNRLSPLNEYWMYCPQIFNEVYPGETVDDHWRGVQSLVYRRVSLEFIKRGQKSRLDRSKGRKVEHTYFIGNKLLFSTSEVNTTLVIPRVIRRTERAEGGKVVDLIDGYRDDPAFKDLVVHHYNHTIVPAGMPYYNDWMFDALGIDEEFRCAIHDSKENGRIVDLVKITGMVSDFITGCSSEHTAILREEIFREFRDKIVEDDLFGNSEGSYIGRWQGERLQALIRRFMERVGFSSSYPGFFEALAADSVAKADFIKELLEIKKKQKEHFVCELFSETFGKMWTTWGDFIQHYEEKGMEIDDLPFFTFVRRVVDYKCLDFVIDLLYDPAFRAMIKNNNAILVLGGRSFGGYFNVQYNRFKHLIENVDPEMKFHLMFVTDHNVFTSWMIQQGTDFGGMLSWKGKEAGPTSYCNAMQNGASVFAVLDGVIPERLKRIQRNAEGLILSGTGYIVEYEEQQPGQKTIRPKKESFIEQFQAACYDYSRPVNYGQLAFNALKMGMDQGDILTQAKGLICVWADQIQKKEADMQQAVASRRAFGWLPYALRLLKEFGLAGIWHLLKEDFHIILAFIKAYGLIRGLPAALLNPIATSKFRYYAFRFLPIYYQQSINLHEQAHLQGMDELDAYRIELKVVSLDENCFIEQLSRVNPEFTPAQILHKLIVVGLNIIQVEGGALFFEDVLAVAEKAGLSTEGIGFTRTGDNLWHAGETGASLAQIRSQISTDDFIAGAGDDLAERVISRIKAEVVDPLLPVLGRVAFTRVYNPEQVVNEAFDKATAALALAYDQELQAKPA